MFLYLTTLLICPIMHSSQTSEAFQDSRRKRLLREADSVAKTVLIREEANSYSIDIHAHDDRDQLNSDLDKAKSQKGYLVKKKTPFETGGQRIHISTAIGQSMAGIESQEAVVDETSVDNDFAANIDQEEIESFILTTEEQKKR